MQYPYFYMWRYVMNEKRSPTVEKVISHGPQNPKSSKPQAQSILAQLVICKFYVSQLMVQSVYDDIH